MPTILFLDVVDCSPFVSFSNIVTHCFGERRTRLFYLRARPLPLVLKLTIELVCCRMAIFLHLQIVYFFVSEEC
jgi:hypothetical protein